ncbi:sigma-70 family RNA polymerase sigma factor [Mesorhizobium sp. M0621]|uniref:sigma-70 family RNA polymerase sigma factor n=2 Tax=unclassified Mesorhizobium TaxID=325217 RepID=UPI003336C874
MVVAVWFVSDRVQSGWRVAIAAIAHRLKTMNMTQLELPPSTSRQPRFRRASVAEAEIADERRRAIVEEIPRLRGYARALMRDRDAADDLVQDSLERALSRMANWTVGDTPRSWLLTIMHNLFIDQLRRAKRHAQAVTTISKTIDAIAMSPEAERLVSVDVFSALQQINPERRAALVLVAVEGLSYDDASKALGIPAGTLASRIVRGREELRSILEGVAQPRRPG